MTQRMVRVSIEEIDCEFGVSNKTRLRADALNAEEGPNDRGLQQLT